MTGSLTSSPDEAARTPVPRADLSPAPRFGLDSLPFWLFVAFVAAAGPLILFHYGAYHWFLRDDWVFLADRGSSKVPPLLEPNGGAHWVAVPRLIYLALWQLFGMTTYRPYQLGVVTLHLAVPVLLRLVMRRAGVGPWLASAAAAVIVLFGPGAQNIVWAFQVGFTGSIAYGLAHLLLADHDGPVDRRDLIGFGFGLLAITSSAIGVTTTVAVAVAVLLRRGWKPAFVHGAPLAVIYGGWALIAGADTTGPLGRPSFRVLLSWVRSSAIGTFSGLGHFEVVAWLLVALLVVGMVVAWGPWRERDLRTVRVQLAMPIGLFVAAIFFATTTGLGRWWSGDAGARASRYVYLEAALVLPILAVAAQAIARRWRVLTSALVALFLLPIPFNLGGFTPPVFGRAYMDSRRYILTTAVRMPFADKVPRDVQPVPDPYSSDAVNMGFLLTAKQNGDLTPSKVPLTPAVVNEFRVRLGVAQRPGSGGYPTGCRTLTTAMVVDAAKGDVFVIGTPVAITTEKGGRPTSPRVVFAPASGTKLTIELPDLRLRITPAQGAASFSLCETG